MYRPVSKSQTGRILPATRFVDHGISFMPSATVIELLMRLKNSFGTRFVWKGWVRDPHRTCSIYEIAQVGSHIHIKTGHHLRDEHRRSAWQVHAVWQSHHCLPPKCSRRKTLQMTPRCSSNHEPRSAKRSEVSTSPLRPPWWQMSNFGCRPGRLSPLQWDFCGY